MRERRFNELSNQLAESGVQIVGGDDNVVLLNLRNLAAQNGSIQRGQAALYEVLQALRAVRVDVEPGDLAYLWGNNVESHAIARGLESGVQALVNMLTSIEPDEVFDRLGQAAAFIYTDHIDDDRARGILNIAASNDLAAHGFVDSGWETYRDGLDWKDPEPREIPAEFQQSVRPYRSPFDTDSEW
jgi:hypothetical protein